MKLQNEYKYLHLHSEYIIYLFVKDVHLLSLSRMQMTSPSVISCAAAI